MMHNRRKFLACGVLLAVVFIASCGGDWDDSTGTKQRFDYDLQGTWRSNDPGIYSGTVIIGYDRITIDGYNEKQTPLPSEGGDDSKRPFKGFPKGVALKGYSEEGKIFIEDGGLVQPGIPYVYSDNNPSWGHEKVKLLRFSFGNRVEILQWSSDSNFQ